MNQRETGLEQGVLSLKDCILMGIGGMVGSAIFTLSGVTYSLGGPSAILSWIIAGVVILIYSMCIAELATIFPIAGGIFVYPYEVFGKTKAQKSFAGWFSAWSRLNSSVLGTSFSAIFVSQYLGAIIPGVGEYRVLVAVLTIGLCFILNSINISFMGKINSILTYSLMIVCIAYGIIGIQHADISYFTPFFGQGTMGMNGFLASIPIAMVAYGSIIAISSAAEEIRNPQKTIPKATAISILLTIVMYSLLLFTTFGLVHCSEFANNEYAIYSPMYYALSVGLPSMPWLSILISVAAVFALMTTLLILTMESGRILMISSQLGLLPRAIGKVNSKTKTPINALLLASVIAAVVACFPQFTMEIVNTGSFCSGVVVIFLIVTLITAKRKGIDSKGAFKVPGGLLLPVVSLIIIAFTLTQLDKSAYILSGWWYLIGLIIFIVSYLSNKEQLKSRS